MLLRLRNARLHESAWWDPCLLPSIIGFGYRSPTFFYAYVKVLALERQNAILMGSHFHLSSR